MSYNLKFGIELEDAIEYVSILQEATELDNIELNILSIGGSPLVFANKILHDVPYIHRNRLGRLPEEAGAGAERYKEEDWLTTYNYYGMMLHRFSDKQFDIIWCCDVIEQIEDPVMFLRELSRVAKCGYIRCKHRNIGSSYNIESSGYAGYEKHLWYVEPYEDGLKFLKRDPVLFSDYVPEYTGDYHIGVWWTESIDGMAIGLGKQWREDMLAYAKMTKELKHAT